MSSKGASQFPSQLHKIDEDNVHVSKVAICAGNFLLLIPLISQIQDLRWLLLTVLSCNLEKENVWL